MGCKRSAICDDKFHTFCRNKKKTPRSRRIHIDGGILNSLTCSGVFSLSSRNDVLNGVERVISKQKNRAHDKQVKFALLSISGLGLQQTSRNLLHFQFSPNSNWSFNFTPIDHPLPAELSRLRRRPQTPRHNTRSELKWRNSFYASLRDGFA